MLGKMSNFANGCTRSVKMLLKDNDNLCHCQNVLMHLRFVIK